MNMINNMSTQKYTALVSESITVKHEITAITQTMIPLISINVEQSICFNSYLCIKQSILSKTNSLTRYQCQALLKLNHFFIIFYR